MKNRLTFLAAAAAALALAILPAVPAQAANQFSQTVSATSSNTQVTFTGLTSPAGGYKVDVANDGPNPVYVSLTSTTPGSGDNTSIQINSCEGRTWYLNQSGLPTFNIATASSTATVRVQGYANVTGGSNLGALANSPPVLFFTQCSAPNTPSTNITVPAAPSGTNIAGTNATFAPGPGTGNAVGVATRIQRALIGATGSAAQAVADAVTVCESKTMSNTSATLTTMAQLVTASNTGGSGIIFYGTTATDGTNFDSDAASMNFAWVNKAGTVTTGVGTLSSIAQASNSGSVASTATAPASGVNVNLSLSPTYTTIVPTSVTSYMTIVLFGPGTVACQ